MIGASPCKGCSERYIGCHGKCETYLKFADSRVAASIKRKQENNANEFIIESTRRNMGIRHEY